MWVKERKKASENTSKLEIRQRESGGDVGREKDAGRGHKILERWRRGQNTHSHLLYGFISGLTTTHHPPTLPRMLRVCEVLWELDLPHANQNGSVPVAVVTSDSIPLPCPQGTWKKQP